MFGFSITEFSFGHNSIYYSFNLTLDKYILYNLSHTSAQHQSTLSMSTGYKHGATHCDLVDAKNCTNADL